MFKDLIFFLRFFAFWLIFHFLFRLAFLFTFRDKIVDNTNFEILKAFEYGIRLDLSITGYFFLIPLFTFIVLNFQNKKNYPMGFFKAYNIFLIVVFSLINIIDINIYREWGNKVNEKVFTYLFNWPKEAMAASASSPVIYNLTLFGLLLILALLLFKAVFKKPIKLEKIKLLPKVGSSIVLFALTFLCIRGGLGVAPNNQSMAYYSLNPVLNHAAVNTEWNLLSSFLASKKTKKNPYTYFTISESKQVFESLYKVEKDTSISLLSVAKPNIVLVLLESFTANLTEKYGNLKGVTPHFDQILKQGYSFDSIYAAGNRTDKGLIATLSGYPTLGSGSIVKWPEKMQKIPAFSQKLKSHNYTNLFFYGGELEFDNYKAFLLSHDFDHLIDKHSFNKKDMNSKWGTYDGLVFQHKLNTLSKLKEPFFSTILTLTHHEPFELPGNYKFGSNTLENKFKSTAYYTDSVINNFLNSAKKENWYKNTLFVFIADHGHNLPKGSEEIYEAGRYHIPMVFYGEALKKVYSGKSNLSIGSQQDLAATLLAQLGITHTDFRYSKNLLNPYAKNFAYYTWDNGFGFITPNKKIAFDNVGKNIVAESGHNSVSREINLKNGKSYLQLSYQEFIDL